MISRGLNREAIFRDPEDYEDLLSRLRFLSRETGMKIHAWSFLPNHFHLLTETGITPLATFMRRALTGYSLHYNEKYSRIGYLFQGRYKSRPALSEEYCRTLFVYINKNPVKHGLVGNITELDNYPWCGHREMIAPGANDLSCFHRARDIFANRDDYISAIGLDTQVSDGEIAVTLPFKLMRTQNEIVSSLDAIIRSTASQRGVTPEAIRGRGRTGILSRAREAFLEEAVHNSGFTITQAAAYLGMAVPSASVALARRVSRKDRSAASS